MAKQPNLKSKSSNILWPLIGVGLVAAAGIGFFLTKSKQGSDNFTELATAGKDRLEKLVETRPDFGREPHQPESTPINYQEDPPTSGVHWGIWNNAGFYTDPQPTEKLVHSLEHGNVVIYYDDPGAQTLAELKKWSKAYPGESIGFAGVVSTPRSGLGKQIWATAWDKRLLLDSYDPELVAAFIDAYRGRGPEAPSR